MSVWLFWDEQFAKCISGQLFFVSAVILQFLHKHMQTCSTHEHDTHTHTHSCTFYIVVGGSNVEELSNCPKFTLQQWPMHQKILKHNKNDNGYTKFRERKRKRDSHRMHVQRSQESVVGWLLLACNCNEKQMPKLNYGSQLNRVFALHELLTLGWFSTMILLLNNSMFWNGKIPWWNLNLITLTMCLLLHQITEHCKYTWLVSVSVCMHHSCSLKFSGKLIRDCCITCPWVNNTIFGLLSQSWWAFLGAKGYEVFAW